MVVARVITAHDGSDSGSRGISAQATAMCAALRRCGIDATLQSEIGSTRPGATLPDVAVLELDATSALHRGLRSEIARLSETGVPLIARHHDAAAINDVFPPISAPLIRHAATSLRSRRQLIALGYSEVALLPYTFDTTEAPVPAGARRAWRDHFAIGDDVILVLQPTRVSERKNPAGSIRYLQQLARVIPGERLFFWVTGPVDAEFESVWHKLLGHLPVSYAVTPVGDINEAYAACDAVVYPTTRERFGPVIFESIRARKPCAVGRFAALGEIEAQGIQMFALDEPAELIKFLAKPTTRLHDVNQRRAALAFGPEVFDAALLATLQEIGVLP